MMCPKCNSEVQQQSIQAIYGIRGGVSEILAAGDLQIHFCSECKIAILSDRIITPASSLILSTE